MSYGNSGYNASLRICYVVDSCLTLIAGLSSPLSADISFVSALKATIQYKDSPDHKEIILLDSPAYLIVSGRSALVLRV